MLEREKDENWWTRVPVKEREREREEKRRRREKFSDAKEMEIMRLW